MSRRYRVGQILFAKRKLALIKNLTAALALPAALYLAVGISAPVAAQTAAPSPYAQTSADTPAAPSKLDYVVLASLADSSSLLSMTAYRAPTAATAEQRKKAPAVTAPLEGE